MKLIIAYTRPESLQQVKQELYQRSIFAMSITNILGAGRQKGYVEMYRGIATEVNLLKKIRLELAVPDDSVKTAIEAIMAGARTGKEGDGVVFVLDVAENYRIRTGESMWDILFRQIDQVLNDDKQGAEEDKEVSHAE